jgi:hypothetical protein
LTLFSTDLLRSSTLGLGQGTYGREKRYQEIDRMTEKNVLQEIKEAEALTVGHKVITGTSSKVVIQNAERLMK